MRTACTSGEDVDKRRRPAGRRHESVATNGMTNPMAVDPNEVARFKSALARLSSAEIQRRLDGSVIIRPWKRSLAEDEDGRRERAARATEERDSTNQSLRQQAISQRVWALVGIAIIATLALMWTAILR